MSYNKREENVKKEDESTSPDSKSERRKGSKDKEIF